MSFYFLNIINWLETHQLPCMFKAVTHIDCPGCGIQRSFILLIKGDVAGSFLLYPALIPIIFLFIFLAVHVTKKMRYGTAVLKYTYIFCAGLIMVSYIYKLIVTNS
ncbi:MAG: DUF2752 domain-containing protein [Ferruginibacter sp.]